jgi:hypothetical protein
MPTTRLHLRGHTVQVPESFEHVEKLKSKHLRRLSAPTLPPPAYTQHAIGQCGGRKDPGAWRHWEWSDGGSRDAGAGVV